jgi:arylsulfatase A-like enzyme
VKPRPNIVFILADDMGCGDMSLFNGGLSQTPVLDALAGEGVCLTQHYSASPVCNPARAALLTGRYPHRTGSIDTFWLPTLLAAAGVVLPSDHLRHDVSSVAYRYAAEPAAACLVPPPGRRRGTYR